MVFVGKVGHGNARSCRSAASVPLAALRLQWALFPTERNGLFWVQQYTPVAGPKRAAARFGCARRAGEKYRCNAGLEIQGELPSRTRYHWKGVRLSFTLLRLNRPILECVWYRMKCQQCDKPAVFHITELESGAVRELHLCEDHARNYLNQSELNQSEGPDAGGGEESEEGSPAAGDLPGPLGVGQTAGELAMLDQRACDMCGITFFEFRNQGRLGCPHDYVQFENELEPLIGNIHGGTEHAGRRPSRAAAEAGKQPNEQQSTQPQAELPTQAELPVGTDELTRVIGMRREMKEAIACEDYEKARENRDAIRALEERWSLEER